MFLAKFWRYHIVPEQSTLAEHQSDQMIENKFAQLFEM